jgi:hypothetical protein
MTSRGDMPIIRIYDDEQGFCVQVKRSLEAIEQVNKNFRIELLGPEDFKQTLDDLQERRKSARQSDAAEVGNRRRSGYANPLDETDIFIVDFDLLNFRDGFVTGEEVAYLARCYSRCGLVIAVNQFIRLGENYFDLTLKGHLDSYADLNLTIPQLKNPGLWVDQWKEKIFRPWYWPSLPNALKALDKRVRAIASGDSLDAPILEFLGVPEEIADTLPRSTRAFLGAEEDTRKVTFRQFVESSSNGLRDRDYAAGDQFVARIAAARVHKWLERAVLPGQDILVDAPHLVSRFPSLLKSKTRSVEDFDGMAVLNESAEEYLNTDPIKKHRFRKKDWLSRPVWFASLISTEERIQEVARPWDSDMPEFVFCEDVSRFLPRHATKEFIADFASPFARRFIVDTRAREGKEYASALRQVRYVPSLRLSL